MRIFAIIPCYKVTQHIEGVIVSIGPEVEGIIAVDDCCPDESGKYIEETINDKRVTVIYNKENLGVGGAVMAGYNEAMKLGGEIFVKVDGDGQMDGGLIPELVAPIALKKADYVKGNRFYSFYNVRSMPRMRLLGNAVLSFITKLSSGYWSIFDPTNGFTAIHAKALSMLPQEYISNRYFFETDMLIQLGNMRAKVQDMPMEALYGEEVSGLKISLILREFLTKHIRATLKRILYTYYLRDFSIASLHLPFGVIALTLGTSVGIEGWIKSISSGVPATSGTVILAAMPVILGVQFLLSFLSYDISSEPKSSLQQFWVR
ncbi:MAG: glycosyltransferase family 2 protein [Pseudomonadales bacterium]|nr:glycosyltransferase family 2 protein [Pseudomonadales bacterium]